MLTAKLFALVSGLVLVALTSLISWVLPPSDLVGVVMLGGALGLAGALVAAGLAL